MKNKKVVNLKVNGIHCGGCVTKIKNNLNTISNELETDVDVKEGKVKVVYDGEKVSLSDIKSKITEVGFSVESVELE